MGAAGPAPVTRRAGVVLAGGRSRRFGPEDKALAELGGDALLARVVDRISTVTEEVVVSCRQEQVEPFERALPSATVDAFVVDRHSNAGPVAGIEAGLDAVSAEYAAVVACDMPFVEPAVVEELFQCAEGVDAAVPESADGRLQPVQAVYRTGAMQVAASRTVPDGGGVHDALDALDVATVPADSLPERSLHNVNTRRDLAVAERHRVRTDGI